MRIPCQCGQRTSLLPCLAAFSAPGLQEEQSGRGRRLECSDQCWALLEQEEEVRPDGPAGIPGLARRQESQAAKKKVCQQTTNGFISDGDKGTGLQCSFEYRKAPQEENSPERFQRNRH